MQRKHFSDAKDVFALLKGHERKVAAGEEPTFTWFKAGQEFDPQDRFKVTFKVVHLPFVDIDYTGWFMWSWTTVWGSNLF